jgi:hypothetical protein
MKYFRQSHHLNLEKSKTGKISNVNRMLYNDDEDIMFHEHEKRRIIETMNKYRNFKSYSPHKLYKEGDAGNGGMLDKFYEVKNHQLDLVQKKYSLDLNWKKMTPRPDIPKK